VKLLFALFLLFVSREQRKEMADQGDEVRKVKTNTKVTEKVHPAQIYAEDMSEEWSKDAVKAGRDAFALTIASGDVHSTIADFIRKKFDRDHEKGWNCIVGRSFGAYVTHEIKTYIYFSVQPGTYVLLWRS
jgi:dynein light chain LC8-type